MTKIIATSDLHGELPDIPPCDLLLLAGDLCIDGSFTTQAKWLDQVFRKWLSAVPAKEIVGVAGNHDLIFERGASLVPQDLNWHYLQDDMIELFGLKIYGTPWQLPFWGAFNLPELYLQEKYRNIPENIDILISHGPPYGILDKVGSHHAGSHALRSAISQIKPKLFVCGHIHCDSGTCEVEGTLCANVCLLDDYLKVSNPPALFNF